MPQTTEKSTNLMSPKAEFVCSFTRTNRVLSRTIGYMPVIIESRKDLTTVFLVLSTAVAEFCGRNLI